MLISIDACVAQHQGDRREQQDRVAIPPHPRGGGGGVGGIGGRHGRPYRWGHCRPAGDPHRAQQPRGYSARTESARVLLESCINEAHMLIKASRFINEKDPHSTVVMLLLQPGRVSWAHCGDSRFYHFRGDALLFRSTDHSYVAQLVVQGRITPEQALVHPNRNILLTSLGGGDAPKIAFGEAEGLQAGTPSCSAPTVSGAISPTRNWPG
ncbi:serine/threonine-protein phosphatase [Accumulibacter sp.]|uniref:PP2C family protein-serine/threonine phosphatase n=1 Tax=Accumulibacter sp. TaxID=2053492 RepID=UPI0033905503